MKLIFIITSPNLGEKLSQALIKEKLSCTKIESRGGFLNKKNITLLLAVKEEKINLVLSLAKKYCAGHTEYLDQKTLEGEMGTQLPATPSIPIRSGGANIFIAPLDDWQQL